MIDFFRASALVRKAGMEAAVGRLRFGEGRLYFEPGTANAYFASVASDFIRHRLLAAKVSFTFETVMSSPDKVAFLAKARAAGCRTYVYYVATDDPIINQSRVRIRINEGGHSVPPDKIVSRYDGSLNCCRRQSEHRIAPTFSTTPVRTENTPGWLRSPMVGGWN